MNTALFIFIAILATTLTMVAGVVLGAVSTHLWLQRFGKKENKMSRSEFKSILVRLSIFATTIAIIESTTVFGLIFITTQGWSLAWVWFNLLGFLFIGSMTLFEGIRLTLPKKR